MTLLENNSKVWVLGEQGDWVEIVLADGELSLTAPISATTGWAAAQFVNLTTELVDPALVIAVNQAVGRVSPVAVSPPAVDAPVADVTPTAEITSGIETLTSITPTLTVSSTNGLNLRAEPSVDAPIVRLLENGATAPVLAVSEDGLWYQIRLDDGVVGWAFGEFVVITGDLSVLPLPAAPAAVAAPSGAVSVPVTETATVTQPVPAVPAVEGAVATVTRLLPVYAIPDSTQQRVSVLLGGATVQVAGRSADGAYVQVLLPTGEAAWAPLSGVELNVEPATLPVTDGS